ncbi:DinB superfamily protein [Polaribacter sp. KT25b]|uniref:DinB family protein n=1 Tax=Polaribacter sp. KT25b TaxID=1855336 RepID=UPI00087B7062|nr:DinB family protein [Polaribacter sp. KT25b]SDS16918.1 DinB superfamily protein [Polaribacter sp. KT25b]
MNKKDLQPKEYHEYYARYIDKVDENIELNIGFEVDKKMVVDFFNTIPKEKQEFRYQPEKWTIKEVLQHIIDTERVFIYRLFCIARNDKTAFPGYEQDDYIAPSEANKKSMEDLIEEFSITRLSSLNLIKSISKENLKNLGTASDSTISARACAFILLGHSVWHIEIIKERYL